MNPRYVMNSRYGIIVNPKSGKLPLVMKIARIQEAASILGDCVYAGIDTTKSDFVQCAQELADKVDVLIIAGGDGTVSDIINGVDLGDRVLSYLPFGTGCFMRSAIGMPFNIRKAAEQIRDGCEHGVDVFEVNDELGFCASVGIEGFFLEYRLNGDHRFAKGLFSYLIGGMKSLPEYIGNYNIYSTTVVADGQLHCYRETVSCIVSTHSYFGGRCKISPNANIDDGKLHVHTIQGRFPKLIGAYATGMVYKNMFGDHIECEEALVNSPGEQYFQIDGEIRPKGKSFSFRVLSGRFAFRY